MKILLIILIGLGFSAKGINPDRQYLRTPETFGIKYSEYKVKTPDHYDINVWEYSTLDNTSPTKTMIFVGTDAGNMSYSVLQARAFREKGLRVITFDYRGFGHSADFEINKDLLLYPEYSIDLDTVIKATRDKYPADKIGLYALSMGTYISLIRKEKIDFLIAEGFYNDPSGVTERIKITKNKIVTLPDLAIKVKKVKPKMPVLIFCASDDKVTTTEDARLFALHNKVTTVEFKGQHLSGFQELTEENLGDRYIDAIIKFLKKTGM